VQYELLKKIIINQSFTGGYIINYFLNLTNFLHFLYFLFSTITLGLQKILFSVAPGLLDIPLPPASNLNSERLA